MRHRLRDFCVDEEQRLRRIAAEAFEHGDAEASLDLHRIADQVGRLARDDAPGQRGRR